jgi:hypothetical protein
VPKNRQAALNTTVKTIRKVLTSIESDPITTYISSYRTFSGPASIATFFKESLAQAQGKRIPFSGNSGVGGEVIINTHTDDWFHEILCSTDDCAGFDDGDGWGSIA